MIGWKANRTDLYMYVQDENYPYNWTKEKKENGAEGKNKGWKNVEGEEGGERGGKKFFGLTKQK